MNKKGETRSTLGKIDAPSVSPNITEYNSAQLHALGLSPATANYFRAIVRKYGPFADMEALYQFIERFPTDEYESRRTIAALEKGTLRLSHGKWYKPNDTIHRISKESLKRVLPSIIGIGVFRLEDREELPVPQPLPAPLPEDDIRSLIQHATAVPERKGFWRSLVEHRRVIKLKKVETKTAMNYNTALLGALAIIGIILVVIGATVIVALHTLQAGFYRASEDVVTLASDHPAIALAALSAANGHDDDTLNIAAILSEDLGEGKYPGAVPRTLVQPNGTHDHQARPCLR